MMREDRKTWKSFWSGDWVYWAYVLGRAGRREELRALLAESLEFHDQNHRGALPLVSIYANLGEKEKAFEWLDRAFEERPYMLPTVFSDFPFESLWSDPRIGALKDRMQWHGDSPTG